ncbi:glutamate ABC transporter substrate-binding protein [Alloscardovia theropitheci]|uniref:Glutamate ABC transporter substrate-binding protein n=1 Tax=Alloscardovia theropitheci TaxID=2496842 RepID=A0A4R0QZA3_9BIFI|nr:glutamate ABC transporter substrate-binding protein [Alloscardovia theropitheci]TCD53926.1 glutamate ABC transporter substrate-binding protein [Alloscardovia theropitheci]
MKKIITRLIATAVAAVSVVSLAACSSTSATDSDHKITIGIKFDQPGVGFKKGGTYTGFDVSVARYIAHELGYKDYEIVWREAPSKQREAMLQNRDVDMILASYSITDDRKKTVDFAGPYLVAGQDLLVRSDNTTINGPEDLDGKRLCSVTGSTSAVVIKERYSNKVQLMEQPSYAECATALFSGIVDAVTTDNIILAGLASNSRGRLKLVGKPFTQEYYGVGLHKGDYELAKKINAAINKMVSTGDWEQAIEDNTSGTGFTPDTQYNPPFANQGESAQSVEFARSTEESSDSKN